MVVLAGASEAWRFMSRTEWQWRVRQRAVEYLYRRPDNVAKDGKGEKKIDLNRSHYEQRIHSEQ